MRERFTLSVFLGKLTDMLSNWSVDRRVGAKTWTSVHEQTDFLWSLTSKYMDSKLQVQKVNKDKDRYLVSRMDVNIKSFTTYVNTNCEPDCVISEIFDWEALVSLSK